MLESEFEVRKNIVTPVKEATTGSSPYVTLFPPRIIRPFYNPLFMPSSSTTELARELPEESAMLSCLFKNQNLLKAVLRQAEVNLESPHVNTRQYCVLKGGTVQLFLLSSKELQRRPLHEQP